MGTAFAPPPTTPPAIIEKAVASTNAAPAGSIVAKGSWEELRSPTAAELLKEKQVKEDTFLKSLSTEIGKFHGGETHDRHVANQAARELLSSLLKDPANDTLFLRGVKRVAEALKSGDEKTVFHASVVLSNLRVDMLFAKRDGHSLFPQPGLTDISQLYTDTIANDAIAAFKAARSQPLVSDLLPIVRGLGPRAAEIEPTMRDRLDHFANPPFGGRDTFAKLLCRDLVAALHDVGTSQSAPVLERIARKDKDPELRQLAISALGKINQPSGVSFAGITRE